MIRVDKITVQEFRGIRSLTLDLSGKNFAVAGPNGTGKSGIVDALEFALTGNISRLSGKGRGALSIKAHGPHVDSRQTPEKAQVTLDVTIPSLGIRAQITRNVKSPSAPAITPDRADVRAIFERVAEHPEFVLSRREIIKYVLAEPGERSKEIQALLQLDDLETVRAVLLKIANAAERELKPIEQARTSTREALTRALGIAEANSESVLKAANAKRAVLALPPLQRLDATTSVRDGLDSMGGATATAIPKANAKTDIAAAKAALAALHTAEFKESLVVARAELVRLKDKGTSVNETAKDAMLQSALSFFDEEHCPVCETDWEPQRFRDVVAGQRARLAAAVAERAAAEKMLAPIIEFMEAAKSASNTVAAYFPKTTPPLDMAGLTSFTARLSASSSSLHQMFPLEAAINALEEVNSKAADTALDQLSVAVDAIPEPTDRDAARDFLVVGQERLQGYRIEMTRLASASRKATIARTAFDKYGEVTTASLNTIYDNVEKQFREYYRAINSDDESAFEAQLLPSIGKLAFEVNFYGRGFFPPGAYHSEGHQDGMGLCLYLALMKYLLGEGFTFAVLDDVLMSVDVGHRREVCTLLKTAFPNTQFVLTTHDGVWLRHMKTAGLIEPKSGIEFRKWDVTTGPAEWKDIDIWAEIEADVGKNEVRRAAGLLRHQLEYLAAEYCAQLSGRVEYRGDGRYELGELMSGAIGAMRARLKEAKAAANSWGNKEMVQSAEECETAFATAATAASVDQWQINPSVHYNEWANLSAADFGPVVAAFKTLCGLFRCTKCNGLIYLVKVGAKHDMLRCGCSNVAFSLTKK